MVDYNKLLHSFKETIKFDISSSSWIYEKVNKFQFFNNEKILESLDEEILRIIEMLDKGYPFISYHFENGIFNEIDFMESEGFLCLLESGLFDDGDFSDIKNPFELVKETKDFKILEQRYIRAKHLEFFFKYKTELTQNKKSKTLPVKEQTEIFNSLPSLNDSVIIHYGCSDFQSDKPEIYWIGAVTHEPNKAYFFENKSEIEAIEKLKTFIDKNKSKTFIHWSMNNPKFGFKAIEDRYFQLTGSCIEIMPDIEIDLSEYLKNKYGTNYIEREKGRLNNLARLNKFSGIQSDIEVINLNDATNRLELIFSIVQAELQGKLKTNIQPLTPKPSKKNKNLRAQLFEVNKKNYIKLSEEYNFDEHEGEFIYRSFWPIIIVNNLEIGEFSKSLLFQKRQFIEKNGVFDLEIFKRENLDFLQNELNQYYDNLKRGKTKVWDNRKGDYFHVFNLDGDTPKAQTLLIVNRDTTQLEIYFKALISEINNFLKEEQKNTFDTGREFDLQTKNLIAHKLIGENKTSYSSIVFHHIADILKEYEINPLEARKILLDMNGTFSPAQKEIIIEPIIDYLERVDNVNNPFQFKNPTPEKNELTKEQLIKDQNNLIPKVSIANVFNHFEILTKTSNKDGVFYLTEKQLLLFIKGTFIDREPLQQEFNGFVYSKKDVRSVFYRFYKKSTLLEGKQTGLKQKYFDILDKSFLGFNKTDLREFNKTNNTIAP